MLVTKSVFILIFVLNNYQMCTFPLKIKNSYTLQVGLTFTGIIFGPWEKVGTFYWVHWSIKKGVGHL